MAHQKRLSAPQHYPVERKGDAYVVTGRGAQSPDEGIPLQVLLRDVLGFAETESEVRDILNSRAVAVNGSVTTDPRQTIGFMDVISIDNIDKDYRVLRDTNGLRFQEVDDAELRINRVEDKTTQKGGRTQLNLDSGRNMIVDDEYSTRSSLVIDMDSGEIQDELPLEEGNLAIIAGGSHVGRTAEVKAVNVVRGSQSNRVVLEDDDGEFETPEENVYVIGRDEPEVTV